MADQTPRQIRLENIRRVAEVARLMDVVTHETMHRQVELASRDLNEALMWLRQENVDTRRIQLIVDVILQLVDSRLKMVNDGLTDDGPNARLIA
jgi:hypothetical protein